MGIGTFGAFTQARLGIYAATKGLTVTGNNISNINTVGYTRQAVNQVSLRNGGADRYQGKYDVRIGNGALITGLSQLRDPYLDIRYRTETTIVGHNDQQLKGLTSIADIIDEVGKGENKGDGIVFAQFSHFLSSLQQLNIDAAAQANDTLTRASADTLTNLFHFYADKLDRLQSDTGDQLRQEVAALNGVLTGIRDLNSAIRKSEIHGDPGLEMRDERNRLIDKLAEYVKIDVVYTMEDIGAGQQVEKLTISLGNANPDPKIKTDSTVLVDGIYARTFEMPESLPVKNKDYDPKYKADPDKPDPDNDIKQYQYLKADGTGTNTAAQAKQIPNSNYDMSLTKLLDAKGREWSNILSSSTKKLAANSAELKDAPMKAVYSYTVTSQKDGWKSGDEITIAGTTYVAGASKDGKPGIPLNTVSDSDRLAAFIASKLNADNKDYDVTSEGNKIIFTAKNAGAVGQLKDKDGNPLTTPGGAIAVDEYNKANPAPEVLTVTGDAGTAQRLKLKLNADGKYDPDNGTETYFAAEGAALVDYDPNNVPENALTDPNGHPVVLGPGGNPFANLEELGAALNEGKICSYITVQKGGDPVSGSGPAEAPSLKLENGDNKVTLTADEPVQEGKEGDPAKFPPAPFQFNPDGTTTLTSYSLRGADWYKTEIVTEYSHKVELDDNDLYGSIQAFREILTEAGEFSTADTVSNVDENAAIKRGIPYYRQSLDLLARVFANAFNEANNGYAVDQSEDENYLAPDGKVLTLAGKPVSKNKELTPDQQKELDDWALTDFLATNGFAGIDKDGYAVDAAGNQLALDGKPVLVANPPPPPADPDNLTSDETTAQNDWAAFQKAVKGIKDGKFVNADGDYIDATGGKVDPDAPHSKPVEANINLSGEQKQALRDTALNNYLAAKGDKMGGNLFSCRGDLDDGEGITASNISVSRSWSNGDVHIVNTFTKLFGGDVENTTQDNNIGHMISLMSKGLVYDPSSLVDGAESTHLFQGSFQDMLINMCSVLGNDQTEVQTNLNTAATYQVEMDTNRDSVSAVDLNDEAMNMMTYAKSLNAAYRLMTTLDEALERLINNTGIVGR